MAFVALEISRVYAPGHGPGFLESLFEFLVLLVPGVPAAGPFLVGVVILYLLMVRTSGRISRRSYHSHQMRTDWSYHLGVDSLSARVKSYLARHFG